MAGVIQVLEIENDRLKETNTALERQVDQRRSVPDLASRRPPP